MPTFDEVKTARSVATHIAALGGPDLRYMSDAELVARINAAAKGMADVVSKMGVSAEEARDSLNRLGYAIRMRLLTDGTCETAYLTPAIAEESNMEQAISNKLETECSQCRRIYFPEIYRDGPVKAACGACRIQTPTPWLPHEDGYCTPPEWCPLTLNA